MENPRSQTKVAMNFGAMYGLASAAMMLIFYFMGADMQAKAPQYLGYLLLILFTFMGIKNYRDQDLGGYISYGKSLGTGVLISVFGGVVTGAFTLLLFLLIAPEMTQKILDMTQQRLVEQGMPEDQIAMAMEYTRKFMTPTWLFIFSILGSAFMGFIFSLIISIFMKKEENPFGSSNVG